MPIGYRGNPLSTRFQLPRGVPPSKLTLLGKLKYLAQLSPMVNRSRSAERIALRFGRKAQLIAAALKRLYLQLMYFNLADVEQNRIL